MNILVFLHPEPSFWRLYTFSEFDLETSLGIIRDDFLRQLKSASENVNNINISNLKFFLIDISNPFKDVEGKEITDFSTQISSYKDTQIDICVSSETPVLNCPTFLTAGEYFKISDQLTVDQVIQKGYSFYENKDYQIALDVFHELRESNPNDPRPLHYIIQIMLKMGKYIKALSFSRLQLQRFPQNIRLQILTAKAYYKCKDYQQSLLILRSVLSKGTNIEKDRLEANLLIIKNLILLDEIKEALSLTKILKKESQQNPKFLKLLIKIKLAQGNIIKASRLILTLCFYEANYKILQKFIGKYITSYKAESIFLGEVCDCFNDPNQLFFIAKTFYDYGRCNQARPIFSKIFLMQSYNPAFALMQLKNEISHNPQLNTLIEIVNTFLFSSYPLSSFLINNNCLNINNIIGKNVLPDFSKSQILESTDNNFVCKRLKYEKSESNYFTDQLEAIEIILLLQIYLFTNGYITASEKIFLPKLLQTHLSKTIISQTAKLSIMILSFIPGIRRPLSVVKPIFVFGCEAAVPIAYHIINFRGEQRLLQPVIIQDLTFDNLGMENNPAYFEFEKKIQTVPEFGTIIFSLGWFDCKRSINKALKKIKFKSIREASLQPINQFAKAIIKLRKSRQIRILIHPIMVTNHKFFPKFLDFNILLKEKINLICQEITELQFLDFYEELLDDEKQKLKEEYVFNKRTWNSNYLPIMENYINTHIPERTFSPENSPLYPIIPDIE